MLDNILNGLPTIGVYVTLDKIVAILFAADMQYRCDHNHILAFNNNKM